MFQLFVIPSGVEESHTPDLITISVVEDLSATVEMTYLKASLVDGWGGFSAEDNPL